MSLSDFGYFPFWKWGILFPIPGTFILRYTSGKNVRKQLEIDFVVNRGDERCYIQSALSINDPEKKEQEIASLIRIPDSFKKIVVVKDYVKPWWDDNGIQYVGIEDFLLDESLISG